MASQGLGGLEPAHRGHELGVFGGGLLRRGLLAGLPGDQRAARCEQRMVGKTLRRRPIEVAARHGDGTDLGAAVCLRMQRRRSSGRVIRRDMLALQHDHLRLWRKVVGDGNPGDTGADNGEIEFLHEPHTFRPAGSSRAEYALVGPP